MPPAAFSGTLHNRKKADLATIASALKLSQEGTASDIRERIKAHLDANQKKLEKNPQFSGLYLTGRQRRDRATSETVSEQAFQPPNLPASRLAPERDSTPPRRIKAPALSLETVVETPTQERDVHAISAMLKQPEPPTPYPLYQESNETHHMISTNLPPLPASAAPSISTMVITKPKELIQKIVLADPANPAPANLKWVRQKLSNSWNLWCLTAGIEFVSLMFILRSEGRFVEPLGPDVVRPIMHWVLPSLVIPIIAGTLISFSAASNTLLNTVDFDPLTANIVRAAAYYLWPYHMHDNLDLLGEKWRMTGALINVAFALAEAVEKAPTLVIPELKTHATEQRLLTSSASDHEEDHDASEEVD